MAKILKLFIFLFFLSSFFFFEKNFAIDFPSSVIVTICGNNIKEIGEQCDGTDLGGQTCQSLGYYGGTLTCNANCTFNTSNCNILVPPAGGGGYFWPTKTTVVIQGKAYPLAKITILKDGEVTKVITADNNANFKTEITDISPGIWTFSLWAEDSAGRRSIIFSFAVTILEGKITTISNIFLPPTIELNKINLARGEELEIFGQTAPEAKVEIHIESPQEIIRTVTAEKSGNWEFQFDTNYLEEGMHTTRAKAESLEGLKSSFSSVLTFYIGKYKEKEIFRRADFSKDDRVNLIDFSILLYWWKKYNPIVDLNEDGIVNLSDFSILLYYWTG